MNIQILQHELNELIEAPALFAPENFARRKEALAFLQLIGRLPAVDSNNYRNFVALSQAFQQRLISFDQTLFEEFFERWQVEVPLSEDFYHWLLPYSEYLPGEWGKPHHGYENLDLLFEGAFLPLPHPEPNLKPEYGMVRYQPTPASVILELIERVDFKDNDVFYDLGSGLGKVTLLVHLLTAVKTVGVEYQPVFCVYAEEQIARLGLQDKICYLNFDAREVDYADANVFFLFNPFGGVIFDDVLEKLRVVANEHEITICSYGSASQPLSELGWLEKIAPLPQDEMALAIFQNR